MKTDELDQLVVHTETKDITLSQLREMVDANDIIVNPEYQRNYVYDDKRASLLVESILIGIPIPIIYLCEEDDGIYSVIDGQQRIMSFTRYLKNDFSLCGLTTLSALNGLFFVIWINPCSADSGQNLSKPFASTAILRSLNMKFFPD